MSETSKESQQVVDSDTDDMIALSDGQTKVCQCKTMTTDRECWICIAACLHCGDGT